MTLASVPGNVRLRGISSAGVQKATLHTIYSSSVNGSKAQILQGHPLTFSTVKAARFARSAPAETSRAAHSHQAVFFTESIVSLRDLVRFLQVHASSVGLPGRLLQKHENGLVRRVVTLHLSNCSSVKVAVNCQGCKRKGLFRGPQ
jgi:hypothetical protein